ALAVIKGRVLARNRFEGNKMHDSCYTPGASMNTRFFPPASIRVAFVVSFSLLAGCTSTLTVQLGGVGAGTVSSAPAGITCSAGSGACSLTVDNGTAI